MTKKPITFVQKDCLPGPPDKTRLYEEHYTFTTET